MFLLPAIFESENTNQVKNQYAEIVDQRSYKSIFYKQQIKQTNTTGVEIESDYYWKNENKGTQAGKALFYCHKRFQYWKITAWMKI